MKFILFLLVIVTIASCKSEKFWSEKQAMIRKVFAEDLVVELDLSTQVLGLTILEEREERYSEERETETVEASLYPTLSSIPKNISLVSASVIAAKAKQFDDGLLAAVEHLTQNGTKEFTGKREMLQNLLTELGKLEKEAEMKKESLDYCRGFLYAAMLLGGIDEEENKTVKEIAEKIKSGFLADKLRSKPIGFYTWSKELSQIFQQDRLLQEKFGWERASTLAAGLSSEEQSYRTYIDLISKLTNPFTEKSLISVSEDPVSKDSCCFIPPSSSHETELVKKLYGNRSIPEGFNLIDELIKRIQAGEIDLTPESSSGWYDYQVFALEPLVIPDSMPEAERLHLGEKYKEELIGLFKALIALTRETHIKQLEVPKAGAAPPFEEKIPVIDICPELSLEPLATFYLRRARAYSFVRELLESTIGKDDLLASIRPTPYGKVEKPLYEELLDMENLLYGTYLLTSKEIGMLPELNKDELDRLDFEKTRSFAKKWLLEYTDDPDVGSDVRMMVPVFYDIERRKTKVWVVMGYAVKPLRIWFKQSPQATITDKKGNPAKAKLEFHSTTQWLTYPVSAEVYVSKILNRDEFRTLCDKYKTQSAILKALSEL